MHILYLNFESKWRGGEKQIALLADYFNTKGDTVSLAYPFKAKIFDYKPKIRSLKLYKGWWNPLNFFKILYYIYKYKVDIIHANSSTAHNLALVSKLFCPNLKIVVHRRVHKNISANFVKTFKYQSALSDKIICISSVIYQEFIKIPGLKNKCHLIPSALTQDKYIKDAKQNLAKNLLIDQNKTWVGIAAAFTKEKGHEEFLSCAQAVLKQNSNFIFLLAGEGPLKNELQNRYKEYSKNIIFLGQVDNIQEFMSAIDIYYMPSLSEGLGTAFLQAILGRALLIGNDVGGVKDIIIPNQTGYLLKPGSNKAKDIILNYDFSKEKEKIEQAKTLLKTNFSKEGMLAKTQDVYKSLWN